MGMNPDYWCPGFAIGYTRESDSRYYASYALMLRGKLVVTG